MWTLKGHGMPSKLAFLLTLRAIAQRSEAGEQDSEANTFQMGQMRGPSVLTICYALTRAHKYLRQRYSATHSGCAERTTFSSRVNSHIFLFFSILVISASHSVNEQDKHFSQDKQLFCEDPQREERSISPSLVDGETHKLRKGCWLCLRRCCLLLCHKGSHWPQLGLTFLICDRK